MSIEKWLSKNTESLHGKTVAITGSTGGIGREVCRYFVSLGASLILLDRNPERSGKFRDELASLNESLSVRCVTVDLESIDSVRGACDVLGDEEIDIFIHNAGAYSIPRHKCDTGFDNVFQINFVSPYYIIKELLPNLSKRGGRVIVVGSIAHNYSKIDAWDVDFSTRKQASKVYGNAKRYLMFSLFRLFESEKDVKLAVVHPGITFTNITAHYPKWIFNIIKNPMKIIFMKPKKACLSIIKGAFDECKKCEWLGPSLFDIWGYPTKKKLRTAKAEEIDDIFYISEGIYKNLTHKKSNIVD